MNNHSAQLSEGIVFRPTRHKALLVRHSNSRRAAALVGALLVLAAMNVAVISAVTAGGDDAQLSSLRLDTVRALSAAESGLAIVIGELNAERDAPSGTWTLANGQTVEITPTSTTPPLDVEVIGRAGSAQRRIVVHMER